MQCYALLLSWDMNIIAIIGHALSVQAVKLSMMYHAAGERELTQRSAFAEAERHIARTIRAMYEVGHRLPAASPTLEAAQQEEGRNREVCHCV